MATSISADALKIKLEIELDNADNAKRALLDVKNTIDDVTGRSRKLADDIAMQRMAVEGKYDPNIQRDLEIEQAIKLTNKLNLSLAAQNAILDEIATKHFVATTATGPAQDQHIIDYQKAQKEEQRINNARIADQERVEREVTQILESELSNYQRYVNRVSELKTKLADKDISQGQFDVLVRGAKTEYDTIQAAEAKKAQLKQDAADKQEAADIAAATKRQALLDKERKAAIDASKSSYDAVHAERSAAAKKFQADITARDTAETKANNAARQQALNLMNAYSSITERAASDVAYFNSALAAGTITAEEHATALAGVDRRMRSMAGGAGNMGYVVGNVMTGLEDFTTVLSITGFGMDGFAAATRSASNNVGQAVRGLGTAASAIYAPLVSIGMVFAGFAIPAVYRWVTATEDASKATEKWRKELELLLRMMAVGPSEALLDFNRMMTADDIGKMRDVEALTERLNKTMKDITKIKLEIDATTNKMQGTGMGVFDLLVPQSTVDDLDRVFNRIGDFKGGDVEAALRLRFKAIRTTFIEEVSTIGGEEAAEHLKANMKELYEGVGGFVEGLPERTRNDMIDTMKEVVRGVDDAVVAAEEELAKLDKKDIDTLSNQRAELESLRQAREQLIAVQAEAIEAQRIREEGARLAQEVANRAELANDLEVLKLQSMKNRMLGDEQEAERKLLDLSIRRREILESGLAGPAELEGMFNAELEAMAAQIQEDLAKLQEVTVQTGTASEASAYAQANKAVMDTQDDASDRREEEMVELLRAIRDHLAGRNLINFQVQ